ncbi:MAG: dTDP-4-dehydrorhamnose reductase [Planctomycetes bacterium]|nr:dTDP-4-dehydrorhamnose reductase [Planctomycetota bacterium]
MPGMAQPTILLTGANGQLGQELLRSLQPHGRIVAAIRPGSTAPGNCESRQVDLASTSHLRQLVREVCPSLIVNAAAYTAVDAAENDRDTTMAVNGIAPGVLAEEACRLRAALIHFSTDYVFGGTGHRSWREDDAPGPVNFYGQSKLAGEEAIRRAGVVHWILRTSWLYGVGGRNFINTMQRLAAEQSEINVVDDQVGAPTSAAYVADVTSEMIAQAGGGASMCDECSGTFHVACAGETTWHGVATKIFALATELGLGIPIPRIRAIASADYGSAARRPLNSRLDTNRLRRAFGLAPPRWDEELRARLPELYAQHMDEVGARLNPGDRSQVDSINSLRLVARGIVGCQPVSRVSFPAFP